MDGENNGKPYEQMDDLGVPLFLETPIFITTIPICDNLMGSHSNPVGPLEEILPLFSNLAHYQPRIYNPCSLRDFLGFVLSFKEK